MTLFIFSGLPGVGKTAVAADLATRLGAVHLRIDTIEQGLRDLCALSVGGEGYRLAHRIAADNLRLALDVVADCVNPWDLTRREWEKVASDCGSAFVNIEVICSDRAEHRRRVEGRVRDIPGLALPNWEEIIGRDYRAWEGDRIRIDTSGRDIGACVDELLGELERRRTAETGGASGEGPGPGGETELGKLIGSMEPILGEEEYLFASVDAEAATIEKARPWAIIEEREGTTLVLERGRAEASGFPIGPPFRRITLTVHSSLEAVGLTAAVSGALARAGISANVVAAYYHDHVFVPASRAEEALGILRALSRKV